MEEQSRVHISVKELLKIDEEQTRSLGLEVISGDKGLDKLIMSEEINRPGLPLAGFFDCFAYNRIQILGKGEIAYIEKLIYENNTGHIEKFFQHDIPVIMITNNIQIPDYLTQLSNQYSIPILRTRLSSKWFIALISAILADLFAPFVTFHGNFVSIYNIGVLITGKSGIGKSESVLGLVERGHKFICDDIVKINTAFWNIKEAEK